MAYASPAALLGQPAWTASYTDSGASALSAAVRYCHAGAHWPAEYSAKNCAAADFAAALVSGVLGAELAAAAPAVALPVLAAAGLLPCRIYPPTPPIAMPMTSAIPAYRGVAERSRGACCGPCGARRWSV